MEPGLRMESKFSLSMAMMYTSPGLMGRNPEGLHPYQAVLIGYAGHLTVHVYAFQCSTKRPNQNRCGKFRPTALIFTLCFPVGTTLPRNAAGVGHLTGSISSFSPLATARRRFGQFPKKAACSARQDGNRRS